MREEGGEGPWRRILEVRDRGQVEDDRHSESASLDLSLSFR